MKTWLRVLVLPLLLLACQAPPPVMPQASGRGVVQADEEVPAGAVVHERPALRVGDSFVLLRGGRLRGEFRVVAKEAGAYVLDIGLGTWLKRDLDLGYLGEWSSADNRPLHLLSPVDARYHWPLWVGKRWTSEFFDCALGGAAMPMSASYVVEAAERITTPAGTFDTLRVVRSLRLLANEGNFMTRTQIAWFEPAIGIEVRQLVGDSMVELVEYQRGPE